MGGFQKIYHNRCNAGKQIAFILFLCWFGYILFDASQPWSFSLWCYQIFPRVSLPKSRRATICGFVIVPVYQLRDEGKICTEEKVTDIKCSWYTRPGGKKKVVGMSRESFHPRPCFGSTQIVASIPTTNISDWDCRRESTQVICVHSGFIYIGRLLRAF